MSVSNPTIVTTITMMTTLGSKLSLATTSAAAMLRCPVARASAHRLPILGSPSIQHAEAQCNQQQSSEDAACTEDMKDLVDIRHSEQQYHRDKGRIGNPVEHELHPRDYFVVPRPQSEPDSERE
jgi:hypothetical protein